MAKPKKPQAVAAPVAEAPVAVAAIEETPVPADPYAVTEFVLDPHDATLVQLSQERIQNAQLHLQNRKNEFEGLLAQVRTKYEEGGKFTMSTIDVARGVGGRALRR
jgi:hypothetical protein